MTAIATGAILMAAVLKAINTAAFGSLWALGYRNEEGF
jgi:hypothetical protein